MKSRVLLILILLVGCRFEEDGLDWGADAGGSPDDPDDPPTPDDPDAAPTPDDPDDPDAAPTPDDPDAAPTCDDPLTLCGTSCVDTSSDDDHCGSCGHDCDSDETCKDGECRSESSGHGGG
jgi:hypothetical protein